MAAKFEKTSRRCHERDQTGALFLQIPTRGLPTYRDQKETLALSPRRGISAAPRQESPVLVDDDGTIGRPDTRRDIPNPIRKE